MYMRQAQGKWPLYSSQWYASDYSCMFNYRWDPPSLFVHLPYAATPTLCLVTYHMQPSLLSVWSTVICSHPYSLFVHLPYAATPTLCLVNCHMQPPLLSVCSPAICSHSYSLFGQLSYAATLVRLLLSVWSSAAGTLARLPLSVWSPALCS